MLHPPVIASSITFHLARRVPDSDHGVFHTIDIEATSARQVIASNKRRSIYKHTVAITWKDSEEGEHSETCTFTTRGHPKFDSLGLLEDILKNIRYLRSHVTTRPPSSGAGQLRPIPGD